MSQHAPESFDGTGGARRWLVTLRRTYLAQVSNKEWLEEVDSKLKGEVIEWADNDSEARAIQALTDPSDEDKQRYIELLIAAFPGKEKPTATKVELMKQVEVLRQEESESIEGYYNRANSLLQKMKIKDCTKDTKDITTEPILYSRR